VISAIAANGSVTATPASRTLTATCSGGAPVEPSWSIDSYDRAVIDGDGKRLRTHVHPERHGALLDQQRASLAGAAGDLEHLRSASSRRRCPR